MHFASSHRSATERPYDPGTLSISSRKAAHNLFSTLLASALPVEFRPSQTASAGPAFSCPLLTSTIQTPLAPRNSNSSAAPPLSSVPANSLATVCTARLPASVDHGSPPASERFYPKERRSARANGPQQAAGRRS